MNFTRPKTISINDQQKQFVFSFILVFIFKHFVKRADVRHLISTSNTFNGCDSKLVHLYFHSQIFGRFLLHLSLTHFPMRIVKWIEFNITSFTIKFQFQFLRTCKSILSKWQNLWHLTLFIVEMWDVLWCHFNRFVRFNAFHAPLFTSLLVLLSLFELFHLMDFLMFDCISISYLSMKFNQKDKRNATHGIQSLENSTLANVTIVMFHSSTPSRWIIFLISTI